MNVEFLRKHLASLGGSDGTPSVAVERVPNEEPVSVRRAIESILTATGAESLVRQWKGKRVVLKPNFCRKGRLGERVTVASVEATLSLFLDNGCDVVMGDGMTQAYLPPRNAAGYSQVAALLADVTARYRVPFIHFDEPRETRIIAESDGEVFYLPSCLKDAAGLVNLAALKVHPEMVGSFAIKNLMGLLSGPDRLELHRTGIAKGIWRLFAAAARVVPQQIHLIDGLYSFQGYDVTALRPMLFLGSLDPCALDIACARVMGIDPTEQFPQNQVAAEGGFSYEPVHGIRWTSLRPESVSFRSQIPCAILDPPQGLPSVRVFWGEFSYPYNTALREFLDRMQTDLPLDLFVGGAAPRADVDGRWAICLGNASVRAYKGGCERVTSIEGDPPTAASFAGVLAFVQTQISTL